MVFSWMKFGIVDIFFPESSEKRSVKGEQWFKVQILLITRVEKL